MTATRLRGCFFRVGVIFAMLILFWMVRGWILSGLGLWLDVGEPPRQADYAMILIGDENTRPFAAAALYKSGWVRHVLVSRGKTTPRRPENDFFSCNEIIRLVMLKQGMPAEKLITMEGSAETTFDEAEALAFFLQSHEDAKVLIVTNQCHTRRAKWIFSRVLPSRVNFSMISVPTENYELSEWWKTDAGWLSVLGEYFKLIFYSLRYGWGSIYFVVFVAAGGYIIYFRYYRGKSREEQRTISDSVP